MDRTFVPQHFHDRCIDLVAGMHTRVFQDPRLAKSHGTVHRDPVSLQLVFLPDCVLLLRDMGVGQDMRRRDEETRADVHNDALVVLDRHEKQVDDGLFQPCEQLLPRHLLWRIILNDIILELRNLRGIFSIALAIEKRWNIRPIAVIVLPGALVLLPVRVFLPVVVVHHRTRFRFWFVVNHRFGDDHRDLFRLLQVRRPLWIGGGPFGRLGKNVLPDRLSPIRACHA